MPQFPPNPAWKAAIATSLTSQPATFFQLATVSAPLIPHCRTLTFGGFFGETPYAADSAIPVAQQNQSVTSDVLFVASDARSTKFEDLRVSQNVEAVFFFPALWSQYRIRGKAFPISTGAQGGEIEAYGRKLVESHLAKSSDSAQWDWEAELKKIYERQDQHLIKDKFPAPTEEQPIPKDFRIVVVVPDVVEQLLPGDNKAITWTATVQEDKESIDWVCTERTLVKKVMSKL